MRIRNYPDMKFLRNPILALGLVTCLLVIGGVFANQSAAHSLHHGHHKATTHASVICTWMCAAGQVVEVANPTVEVSTFLVSRLQDSPSFLICTVSPLFIFERGPPSIFL
jgi:hypothetical protein